MLSSQVMPERVRQDPQAAVNDFLAVRQVSGHLREQKLLLTGLVAFGIDRLNHSTMTKLLRDLPPDQLRRLVDLPDLEPPTLKEVLAREQALSRQMWHEMSFDDLMEFKAVEVPAGLEETWGDPAGRQQLIEQYIGWQQQIMDVAALPRDERAAAARQLMEAFPDEVDLLTRLSSFAPEESTYTQSLQSTLMSAFCWEVPERHDALFAVAVRAVLGEDVRAGHIADKIILEPDLTLRMQIETPASLFTGERSEPIEVILLPPGGGGA
jgi:hypothetical protein